jgi:cell division protein FtsN
MARDYKHRATRKRKKKTVSPWIGMVAGLLIGLFVAFLVFIKMQASPTPAQIMAPVESIQQDTRDVQKGSKQAIPPPPKPRFDFYTLLPEMEVVVPEEEVEAQVKAQAVEQRQPEISPPGKGETYYLQVGSFKNGQQAERFKAELALMGLETSIQKVTINNADTWHRVRVGPFNSLGALDKVRRTLGAQGIDSTTIRIKG